MEVGRNGSGNGVVPMSQVKFPIVTVDLVVSVVNQTLVG